MNRRPAGHPRRRIGAVYFRSLASNGTPSATEARPSDWADIIEICFDNREADVAGSSGDIWLVSISHH
jgi:hypothetical protein